jgi:hypothetical protein
MTRALVWKEVREQWSVWLTLTLAAAAGAGGLLALLSPGRDREWMLVGVLWFVAWGYGLVCGSLLLAGEAEDGTQIFLDTLTRIRRHVWLVKAATGLGLLAAQLLVLGAFGVVCIRQGFLPARAGADLAGVLLAGGIGYAWGLFCGSFSGNVLSAVGWAVLLQAVAGLLLFPVVALPINVYVYDSASGKLWGIWLTSAGLASLAVGGRSRRVYCLPDELREQSAELNARGAVQPGWGGLFWLAWQQMRGFTVAMVVFGVFAAVGVSLFGMMTWPLVTVFAGILCGITTFADEQQSGAFRFAGDQRYPLGRVWLVKSSVRLAAALATALVIALGVAAGVGIRVATLTRHGAQQAAVDQLPFFTGGSLFNQPVLTLTLWPVYGYAVGLLCGILFRKPLVAGVVAVGVAYPLVSLWIPSVALCGWMVGWQVLGVPVILLAGSRLLMRPWASDRLLSRGAVAVAIGAVLAACLWLAAALAYRAVEIPPAPDAVDIEAFKASFPGPEKNESGRVTLGALRRLADVERAFQEEDRLRQPPQPPQPQVQLPAPARPQPGPRTFQSLKDQAGRVASRGWGAGDPELGAWLDRMFSDNRVPDDNWAKKLSEVDDRQTGITFDPRNANNSALPPELRVVPDAAVLLVAVGLRRQADGDPADFLGRLRTGLALARNLRHATLLRSVAVSSQAEGTMLRGVDLWLEELDGRPDLLRRALRILQLHESAPQTDPELIRRAELLVTLNTFTDPRNLDRFGPNNSFPGQQAEADLLRFSLQVPWEKARLRRLLDGLASLDPAVSQLAANLSPPLVHLPGNRLIRERFFKLEYPDPRKICLARAALLEVALRLYQVEKGKPAGQLADLVPEYLSAVPEDPFDGRPFRYRLSRGESLDWPPPDLGDPAPGGPEALPVRQVPAGQGILWCVGEDKQDDGGQRQQSPHAPGAQPREDVIFLVPLPPVRR